MTHLRVKVRVVEDNTREVLDDIDDALEDGIAAAVPGIVALADRKVRSYSSRIADGLTSSKVAPVHNFSSASTIGIDIGGAQSAILGEGYHKITGSNIGIRRLDNTGGQVSYFERVIVTGVTTNKQTGAGTAGWVDATFM